MKYLLSFIFVLWAFSAQAYPGQKDTVVVKIGHVMKAMSINYFKADAISNQPKIDWPQLDERIQQIHDNAEKVSKLNTSKDLKKPIKKLLKEMDRIEKARVDRDLVQIRESMNAIYMNCFKCHSTHRDKVTYQ